MAITSLPADYTKKKKKTKKFIISTKNGISDGGTKPHCETKQKRLASFLQQFFYETKK